ncbi:hypothetical protein ACFFX1_55520 [Dactylosporangium sucinum]|uniref:Uncharacterized protein n=1 Tax=Dactylosporangium sucinum TaxID=1424081 RepID=A0A917U3K6_9ACTN|nr:hypothetical protein [Dactylosporangium sucinum]GGM52556.1 hypothetical protein GCM10007977_062600 [Dactylosporangium sucinum]
MMFGIDGRPLLNEIQLQQIADMTSPVRCTCGRIYDLGKVTVTARYADCSIWKAPCCGRQADDRGETGWKTTQDYYRLDRNGREVRR